MKSTNDAGDDVSARGSTLASLMLRITAVDVP